MFADYVPISLVFAALLLPACGRLDFEPVALSCAELLAQDPSTPSGTYAVGNDVPVDVYCDMETFGGGWSRIAQVVAEESCPGEWVQTDTGAGMACVRPEAAGSSQSWASFQPVAEPYGEVMGFVRGMESGSMDCFSASGHDGPRGQLSENYVDGVSIVTFDDAPIHVFTYAVAWSDTDNSENSLCPCLGGTPPPSYVGDDFYCESGHSGGAGSGWSTDDPLWDGDGTGTDCDSPADPSRFHKVFDTPARGPVLVRLMGDQGSSNEDVGVTELELFVR